MIRLQKLIAQAGIASRRNAEKIISQGRVKINNKIAKLGDKATFKDQIIIDGISIISQEEKVYYVLNKPIKTITSLKDPQGRKTVIDIVKTSKRIFPIGRLDYDTTGVLILTNDGNLAHKLSHPSFEIMRVYRVRIDSIISEEEFNFLNSNNVIINKKISFQKIKKVDNKSYIVSLHQGSYHHVKKLFELINKKIISLTRIEYAGINVLGLSKGEYRKLKPKEIKWLKTLINFKK